MNKKKITTIASVLAAMALVAIVLLVPVGSEDVNGEIPSTVTEVGTYDALVTAIVNDFNVKLTEDIAVTSTLEISKDGTIDLNGHKLTATDKRVIWIKCGDVTLSNGGSTAAEISATGSSLVETSSVIRVGDSGDKVAKLTVGENIAVSTDRCHGISVFGTYSGNETYGQILVVNGSVSTTGNAFAITGNGTSTLASTNITIGSTAEVESDKDVAVYHPQSGTLTINGSVTGTGGLEMKSGSTTFTVNSTATITATAQTPSHYPNNNGSSTNGYAIAMVENDGYKGGAICTINGGTVVGPIAVLADNALSVGKDPAKITINGGTIKGDITLDDKVNNVSQGGVIEVKGGTFETMSALYYLINGADITITDIGTTQSHKAFDITSGYTLGKEDGSVIVNVLIKDSYLDYNSIAKGTDSLFYVKKGSAITLDNVDLTTTGTALYPSGNAASVTVQNGSKITAGVYCVGTNSTGVENYGVEITLTNSTFVSQGFEKNNNVWDYDDCTVMINVEGTLSVSNCIITGDRQALLVRAGTATVTDSTINFTGSWLESHTDTHTTDWDSGNEVISKAIVLGNRNGTTTGSYTADASLTIDKSTVLNSMSGSYAANFSLYATSDGSNGKNTILSFNNYEAKILNSVGVGTFQIAPNSGHYAVTIVDGKVTLTKDLDINTGDSLTVNSEAELIISKKMINGGTLINNGTVVVSDIFDNTGTITNSSGTFKFGSNAMVGMTQIQGQVSFDGNKTLTAASGSSITWATESLTATNGTFEMAVDNLDTVIKTGTVTLDKGTVDDGQIITVNKDATLRIINGIDNDGTIINNGTIRSAGDVVNDGTLTNAGDIRFISGSVTNKGTINNTGDIGFVTTMAQAADPGTTGLTTSGEGSTVSWYATSEATSPVYRIASTDKSGSFKMTGIYSGSPSSLVGIKTEFTAGSIVVDVDNNTNDVWTISSGADVTVPSGKTVTIYGKVTNNGVIFVEGTLVVDATAGAVVGTNGITGTSGTVNVYKDATLNPASAGLVQGTINVFQGATLTGAIAPADAMFVMTNSGTTEILGIVIENKTAGDVRDVTYTLKGTATANVGIDYFLPNDKLVVDKDATLNVTALKIGDGVKFNVAGKVIGADATITLGTTGTIEIASTGNVAIKKIDMTVSKTGVKAIMIKAGGVITALVDGSTGENASMATLTNISAGNGGLSIIKGSVYINGTLATPVDGKITVAAGAGAVKISGNVEEGVTLVVEENASIVVPKDSTLTFEEGSKFNYDNAATITFEEKSSSIIYEKGSEVNDVVIKVETKEDSEGTTVAVRIYLVSENEKKLIISVDYVEVLPGKTYGDALNGVIVMPTKKSVTFEGWYNLAFNEKIRSTDIVGNNDVTLTACFSDEGRVPVQKEDTPSETIIIDGTTDSQSFAGSDFALPVAIICLIVAILALGFVVLKKR